MIKTQPAESETEYHHCRKIRIKTTPDQLRVVRQLFGVKRKMYNAGINMLKEKKAQLSNVRDLVTKSFDNVDYCKAVPLKIRQGAVEDLIKAVRNCRTKWKQTGKPHRCKYQSKRAPSQSIYMNFNAIQLNNEREFWFYKSALTKFYNLTDAEKATCEGKTLKERCKNEKELLLQKSMF